MFGAPVTVAPTRQACLDTLSSRIKAPTQRRGFHVALERSCKLRLPLLFASFVQSVTNQAQQRWRHLKLSGALSAVFTRRCYKRNDAPRNWFGRRVRRRRVHRLESLLS